MITFTLSLTSLLQPKLALKNYSIKLHLNLSASRFYYVNLLRSVSGLAGVDAAGIRNPLAFTNHSWGRQAAPALSLMMATLYAPWLIELSYRLRRHGWRV